MEWNKMEIKTEKDDSFVAIKEEPDENFEEKNEANFELNQENFNIKRIFIKETSNQPDTKDDVKDFLLQTNNSNIPTGSLHEEESSDDLKRRSMRIEDGSHTSVEGESSTSKFCSKRDEENLISFDVNENDCINSDVRSNTDASDEESSSSGSDFGLSDDYVPEPEALDAIEKGKVYSRDGNENILKSPAKKTGLKRKKKPETWYRNKQKKLRNEGKAYTMVSKHNLERPARRMKPPCTEKCRLKCYSMFSIGEREKIFSDYWQLGSLEKQRLFIANSMKQIEPSYRYIRTGGKRAPRKLNNAFFFSVDGEKRRICKLFFKNTLDINDRPIRTVQEKRTRMGDLMEIEKRGRHTKNKGLDQSIVDKVRQHINSIPRIESRYMGANTSREFIDGSKTVVDLHKDYVDKCKEERVEYVNYPYFYNVFKNEFNISFFTSKKDQCDTCEAFHNATEDEKQSLRENYDRHQLEMQLSRKEKNLDQTTTPSSHAVAVYDLQAVFSLPKGDVFYYKSKVDVLNFTIYDLKSSECLCYVWDESNGQSGVNELGSCVLDYMEKCSERGITDITFYSNDCGQNKNTFMLSLYLYAVNFLNINSITHKFLIRGHTQTECDSVHALIERNVKRLQKSGSIFIPETFITAIRTAKRGGPFKVKEMTFEDFFNVKRIATPFGSMNVKGVNMNMVKVLKLSKEFPCSVFFKNSYEDDFREVTVLKKKKTAEGVTLIPCYNSKPGISQAKKDDLMNLCRKNLIPNQYKSFYENL